MSAVVIGGGLAGLLAAHRLARQGRRVTVLEASTRLGGMIAGIDIGGVRVDSGAEAYAVRGGVARALCEELGLEVAGPAGQPHIWRPDGVWPMAEGVLGIPSTLEDPALGALSEVDLERLRQDAHLPPEVGADAVTVGDLVRARVGDGALATMVAPVAHGVYSLSPDQMPLAAFAPGLLQALAEKGTLLGAVAAVRRPGVAAVEQPVGGMFLLIDALERAIVGAGGEIRLASPAVSLSHAGQEFAVSLRGGQVLRADRVVLASSAASACSLLARIGVDLTPPPVATARLAVLGVSHRGAAEGLVGSGLLVGERDDTIQAKALTHYSFKWPWARRDGQEILRLSYPEQFLPTSAGALGDASRFLGIDLSEGDLTGFASVSWETMPTRMEHAGRRHYLETVEAAGLDLVGAWLDGNGIASVIAGCDRLSR